MAPRGGQWGRGSPGSPSRDGDRKFDNPGTGTGMGTDSGGRGQERGLKIEKWGLGMGTGTREILCCPRPSPIVPVCPRLSLIVPNLKYKEFLGSN